MEVIDDFLEKRDICAYTWCGYCCGFLDLDFSQERCDNCNHTFCKDGECWTCHREIKKKTGLCLCLDFQGTQLYVEAGGERLVESPVADASIN